MGEAASLQLCSGVRLKQSPNGLKPCALVISWKTSASELTCPGAMLRLSAGGPVAWEEFRGRTTSAGRHCPAPQCCAGKEDIALK